MPKLRVSRHCSVDRFAFPMNRETQNIYPFLSTRLSFSHASSHNLQLERLPSAGRLFLIGHFSTPPPHHTKIQP